MAPWAPAKSAGILDGVNILIVPMLDADGAMGDVNFFLDDYLAKEDRHLIRYNAASGNPGVAQQQDAQIPH